MRDIKVIINVGSVYCNCVNMCARELVEERNKLREDAIKFLGDSGVDHIVYYYDKRNGDGEIEEATLYYNMVGMDDKTFYERTRNINGFVGAVHKRK